MKFIDKNQELLLVGIFAAFILLNYVFKVFL